MPGFGDSAFIILLALLLFGPKKLPVLARQLGKLMGDFRRASNEFRTQMEEELRISEQAERQKQIAALEASATQGPPVELTPANAAHTPPEPPTFAASDSALENLTDTPAEPTVSENSIAPPATAVEEPTAGPASADTVSAPLPIATSGDLTMMPPSTGLPVPKTSPAQTAGDPHETELETEPLHG